MPKKKKYAEKNIIVEVPEDVESVTTVSSTLDVEGIVTTPPDDESDGKERIENLEREVVDLRSELEDHVQHLPLPGPSTTPRRHDTYEVREDGEKLARIAKNLWGVSGRYVEIAALNGITDATTLTKGQILKLPK